MNEKFPQYVLDPGEYNKMPRPYEEITEDQFWHHVLIWGFSRDQVYRQVTPKNDPEFYRDLKPLPIDTPREYIYMHSIYILMYHEYAIGVMQHVVGVIPKPWRFFKIGCKHTKATGTDTMTGWHTRSCSTCGLKWSWDSSD